MEWRQSTPAAVIPGVGSVARALIDVAASRSVRSGPRKRQAEAPAGDGVLWPLLREQQQLRAHIPEAEQRAAEVRAQLLVEKGWGSLEAWLNHKGQHPGEGVARPAGVGGLADLFDDEAA